MKDLDLRAREKSRSLQYELLWLDNFDELSINLKESLEIRVVGILLKLYIEGTTSLRDSLSEANIKSSESFFQTNFARITEAHKLDLSIRMRRLRMRRYFSDLLILVCLFPDVGGASHIGVYVQGKQVLIVMKTINFLNALYQVGKVKTEGVAHVV